MRDDARASRLRSRLSIPISADLHIRCSRYTGVADAIKAREENVQKAAIIFTWAADADINIMAKVKFCLSFIKSGCVRSYKCFLKVDEGMAIINDTTHKLSHNNKNNNTAITNSNRLKKIQFQLWHQKQSICYLSIYYHFLQKSCGIIYKIIFKCLNLIIV
jgi:hypothetical protein